MKPDTKIVLIITTGVVLCIALMTSCQKKSISEAAKLETIMIDKGMVEQVVKPKGQNAKTIWVYPDTESEIKYIDE